MLEPIKRQSVSHPGMLLDAGRDLPLHHESRREIPATAEALFSHLDDHERLSQHMSKSSWMMAGSRMEIGLDAGKGQAVGSHIRLKGRVLGIRLDVEEVVAERTPPLRKAWQTIGAPRLLVIGAYRMGFEIIPAGSASHLCIFIDYALPQTAPSRWLGAIMGAFYARWCTEKMADDAVRAFAVGDSENTSALPGQHS